jgi:hypothetical protein
LVEGGAYIYLGALSLRLDFLHYEEACIQKSFNAIDQAAFFTPRESRRGRTSDASVAKKEKEVQWLYGGRTKMGGKEGENALVPAHSGKGVDGLLDTRLCLLTLKESLELFLQCEQQSQY